MMRSQTCRGSKLRAPVNPILLELRAQGWDAAIALAKRCNHRAWRSHAFLVMQRLRALS